MRIVLDGRLIQDHFPGIGRYTAGLARELPVQPDVDRLIVLRDPRAPNRRFAWSDLAHPKTTVIERAVGVFAPIDQVSFNLQARRLAADLFHFPFPVRPYALPQPSVVTIHDTIPLRWPNLLPRRRDRLMYPWLLRLAAASARIVMTDSEAAQADLIQVAGVPPAKVEVVPIGVEPPPAGARRADGPDGEWLLYVGINKPHKNLPRLVRAYAASRVARPLVIAGPIDPRYPEAARTAAELGLGDRVRFLGLVDEDTLATLYQRAHLFLFPSLAEGFGLPVLEAMAAGVPVIASDIPAIREVAAGAARLIDPQCVDEWAEAIASLDANAAARAELAQAGRDRASQFTLRRTAELVVAAYRRALGG